MLLELTGIAKAFATKDGPVQALVDVSFSVAEGEFVSVVGPSGCGKSTILSLVAGLDRPSAGAITLDGRPITEAGSDRGMVFQQANLFPWLTVLDNVLFGLDLKANRALLREAGAASFRIRAMALLDAVGLGDFAKRYPRELSGGMKQRAALVRALVTRPRILLMDEPFGALDAQTREEMQALLLSLCQSNGTTVLLITHDIDEAVILSDRVLVMRGRPGTMIADLPIRLTRPRDSHVRVEARFNQFRSTIFDLLHRRESRRISGDFVIAG